MDGISGASAVLSLVTTVRDAINFLREIQDAPEELHCTIENLENLRIQSEMVKIVVDEQRSCVDLPDSAPLTSALRTCEIHINSAEICLKKFKGVRDGQSLFRKKWTSFKHVLKKAERQKLQDHLQRALWILQTALVVNDNAILVRHYKFSVASFGNTSDPTKQKASTKIANVTMKDTQRACTSLSGNSEHDETRSSQAKLSSSRGRVTDTGMFSRESLPHPRVISKESIFPWYMGKFGNIIIQTRLKIVDDDLKFHIVGKQSVSEERIIVLRPAFMKNQFELRFVNKYGHISRTLSTDCVVDYRAPVFDMCRLGDVKGLQDVFRSGSASLHVVNPLGMGLLHYAAGSFQKELCSWLLEMGVGADRADMLGNKALAHMGTRSKIDQNSRVTKNMVEIAKLLAQAQNDFSEFDISTWFREYEGPPEGAEIILSHELARYYICAADDSDPHYPALASVLRSYARNHEPWDPVIRTLLRYGADIHAPVRRKHSSLDQSGNPFPLAKFCTPLDELFMYTCDPFEGQVAAHGWLQILESEGYNLSAYIERESALHVGPMQLTHPSCRTIAYGNQRKLVFGFDSHPTVSWDWWISPSSSTYQLREEFRIMAITLPDWLLITKPWKEAWPFSFPVWSKLNQSHGDASSCLRYKKLFERANTRAAKRVAEKAQKLARAQRSKGPRQFPGAWPT